MQKQVTPDLQLASLYKELKQKGYDVSDTYHFARLKNNYHDVLPILLKYVSIIDDPNQKEGLIRGLGVKGYVEAIPILLDEYKKTRNSSLKWAIGNTLWIIGDKTIADELIKILEAPAEVDPPGAWWKPGLTTPEVSAKENLLWALGKTKDKKAIPVLIKFLAQEDFTRSALEGLKYFKDSSLLKDIRPLLDDKHPWVREKAARMIAALEKLS